MEWSWFRRPGGEDPGTTNLCFNAVDRHVVSGAAGEPALTGQPPLDFATLLEQVAALAGAFRGLGVTTEPPLVALADPRRRLLTLLAGARLGVPVVLAADDADLAALVDAHRPRLLIADRLPERFGAHSPAACVVHGVEPVDPERDLTWDIAVKAGRTDPAGCEPVDPGRTAYDLDRPVTIGELAVGSGETPADATLEALALLLAGRPAHL